PPVDAVKGGLAVSQSALVQQQMVRLSAFSQRIDMRMLDKKQIIVGGHLRFRRQASVFDLALHGAAKQFLLIIPGFFVIFQSKVYKFYFFIDKLVHRSSLSYVRGNNDFPVPVLLRPKRQGASRSPGKLSPYFMMAQHNEIGRNSEKLASEWLQGQGYEFIEANYRY